ncbi:hypothetical protein IWZ00DRAFT_347126 [Phyllosticta capitalensis]
MLLETSVPMIELLLLSLFSCGEAVPAVTSAAGPPAYANPGVADLDSSSILQCNNEFVLFNSSSREWDLSHHSEYTGAPITVTSIEDLIHLVTTVPTAPVTTLCDGVPRAGKRRTATQISVTTITETVTPVSSVVEPYTGATPTCSLDADSCTSLADIQGSLFPSQTLEIDCSIPITYTRCAACKIYAQSATLYHWPAQTTDPCNAAIGPVTTPTDRPFTAKLPPGRTLTSPSLYLSFPTVYAYNWNLNPAGHCGNLPSPTVSVAPAANASIPNFAAPPNADGTIIAFDPSELSTLRGFHGTGGIFPFNTDDLAYVTAYVTSSDTTMATPLPAVPSAAYFHTCGAGIACDSTIYDDYAPTLAWPTDRLRALDSAWVKCILGEGDGTGLIVTLSELSGRPMLPTTLIGADAATAGETATMRP